MYQIGKCMVLTKKEKLIWALSRVIPAALFIPHFQEELFVPFLMNGIDTPFDPWNDWIVMGGRSDSFPYGFPMFIIMGSAIFVAKIFYSIFDIFNLQTWSTLSLTALLLVFDYKILSIIISQNSRKNKIKIIGMFSPLAIYITFIYGQIDLIPTFMMLISFFYLKRNMITWAGVFFGLSVATKFSLILALPFVLIYLIRNSFTNKITGKYLLSFITTTQILFIPALWSAGYVKMVLETPEALKSLNFFVQLGDQKLYVLPLGYLLYLFLYFSLPRITFSIFLTFTGIALTSIAILQTGSAGWLYWGFSLLAISFGKYKTSLSILFIGWQFSTIVFYQYKLESLQIRTLKNFSWETNGILNSLIFTTMFLLGMFLLYRIISEMHETEDPYGFRKKPISIAISGDSGVGKDRLTDHISTIIEPNRSTILLGDDYHIAERKDKIWIDFTHLNPGVNNLLKLNSDLNKSLNRKSVSVPHYDHSNGKFTSARQIKSSDFVIINALHALLLQDIDKVDLKIYLSMDEDLRNKLKTQRDLASRNHKSKTIIKNLIKKRAKDSVKFISIQREIADLHIHTTWDGKRLDSIKYYLSSKDLTLVHTIYDKFVSLIPNNINFDSIEYRLELSFGNEINSDSFQIHNLFKSSIVDSENFVLNPNFKSDEMHYLAVAILIAASRNRLLKNEY